MTCECNGENYHLNYINLEYFGDFGIIFNFFVMAFLGGFTHCIFMCGPFISAISQMRLMGIDATLMSQRKKIIAILSLPYYFGKTVSYMVISVCAYYVVNVFSEIVILRYIGFIVMVIAAFLFFIMGVNGATHIGVNMRFLNRALELVLQKISIKGQFGIKGFITGMILGYIPCGMVLAAVVQAVSIASNFGVLLIYMLAFGLGTVPALMMIAFFGDIGSATLPKKIFVLLYSIVMIYNGLMLMNYAFEVFLL